MNKTLRNVSLILGGLVAAASFLARRPADEAGLNPVLPAASVAATAQVDPIALPQFRAAAAAEFPPGPDTTGLLQESLGIDDLLDEVEADTGDGSTPVDRERLAAALRSDPELRSAMAE
ncbi:MAG: hypothetical protein ACT4UQ_10675 [Gammaproteobacteria bacterium]